VTNIYVEEAEKLIGKKVVGVFALDKKVKDTLMWDDYSGDGAIAIVFEGGTMVIPMADDEGNGAGALMYLDTIEYAYLSTARNQMFAP
jgi:hypothetical protein